VAAGVHLEITNLLIPTLNDKKENIQQLCEWIAQSLDPNIPLHFSRFFPRHRMMDLPPTPCETLMGAREQAKDCGLHHVYIGNMDAPEGEATFCPTCQAVLIQRAGYTIIRNRLDATARCPSCGTKIYGRF
jgi:pyruvate formate lyase activating enzyme